MVILSNKPLAALFIPFREYVPGNIMFQIAVDMDAYLEYIQKERERFDELGEPFVSGAGFALDSSLFFRLNFSELAASGIVD